MNKVTIQADVCKGCGLCVMACPKKILTLEGGKLNNKGYHTAHCIDLTKCIACAMCATMCPDVAIIVEKD